jgi:hypothetical protein
VKEEGARHRRAEGRHGELGALHVWRLWRANVLDGCAGSLVRTLVRNPRARLGFLVWLALLHVWAAFLLLFHVHGLQHDIHKPH